MLIILFFLISLYDLDSTRHHNIEFSSPTRFLTSNKTETRNAIFLTHILFHLLKLSSWKTCVISLPEAKHIQTTSTKGLVGHLKRMQIACLIILIFNHLCIEKQPLLFCTNRIKTFSALRCYLFKNTTIIAVLLLGWGYPKTTHLLTRLREQFCDPQVWGWDNPRICTLSFKRAVLDCSTMDSCVGTCLLLRHAQLLPAKSTPISYHTNRGNNITVPPLPQK